MKRILLIGEAMGLFVAQETGPLESVEKFYKSVSGAELNVSIGLKRLGHEPYYMTKLGDDVLGNYIYKYIAQEDLKTDYVLFDEEHQTGIQLKSRVLEGDADAPYFRKFSAASTMSLSDVVNLDISKFDHIHITGVSLAISESFRSVIYNVIDEAHANKIPISFDPNLRPEMWNNKHEMNAIINDVASKSDYFLPGFDEAYQLTGLNTLEEISEFYLSEGFLKAIVIKNGAKGAYYNDSVESQIIPGFKVEEIVDTVGAGDGFAAGFISSLLEEMPIKEAVIYANAVGAIQLGHWSDNQGLPTREELEQFVHLNT